MQRQNLRARAARNYKAATNSKYDLPVAPNLLAQDFSASAPNQKWVSEIPYLLAGEGWLYLAVITSLSSQLVVGWAMAERLAGGLACEVLQMEAFYGKRFLTREEIRRLCSNILKLTATVHAAIVPLDISAPWRLRSAKVLNSVSTQNGQDQSSRTSPEQAAPSPTEYVAFFQATSYDEKVTVFLLA